MRIPVALALVSILSLSGCWSVQQQNVNKRQETIIDRSASSKPDWLEIKHDTDKDGNLLFVGSVTEVKDLSLGEEEAEYAAKKVIAGAIKTDIQGEFSKAMTGANRMDDGKLGKHVESAISAVIDNVQVSGVVPLKRYWEKIERIQDSDAIYGYNVWLQVRMPKADYDRLKRQVAKEALDPEQVKADDEAKDLLNRVRDRIQTGR